MLNRARAHHAWLECHVKITPGKTVIAKRCASIAKGLYLRMRAGVVAVNGMVVTASDDPAGLHHHGANRNLAACKREVGLLKCSPHEKRIIRTIACVA